MTFDATALRSLPDNLGFSLKANCITFILVKDSGKVCFANTSGKDELIKQFDSTRNLLMCSWTGQWKTDIFVVAQVDLNRHYK